MQHNTYCHLSCPPARVHHQLSDGMIMLSKSCIIFSQRNKNIAYPLVENPSALINGQTFFFNQKFGLSYETIWTSWVAEVCAHEISYSCSIYVSEFNFAISWLFWWLWRHSLKWLNKSPPIFCRVLTFAHEYFWSGQKTTHHKII